MTRKANNPRLVLISCYNSFLMNASEIPVQLSKTQARDLANASTNDLVNDITKIMPKRRQASMQNHAESSYAGDDAVSLYRRGQIFLSDKQFSEAKEYFNKSLDKNPELSKAYWGLFWQVFNVLMMMH